MDEIGPVVATTHPEETPERDSELDSKFFQADKPTAAMNAFVFEDAPPSLKDTEAARARRAHLTKYVLAITALCVLILAVGIARSLIAG